ncbi:MAG: hypothetical protein KF851_14745 [Pirellulaceae bacterium]|nr:hypothetical protein [Pirellulaceae bacterium]
MTTDSINDEILRIKRELAGRFGNDLDLIIADAKSRERNTVSFPPRPWKSEQSDAPNANDGVSSGASSPATG